MHCTLYIIHHIYTNKYTYTYAHSYIYIHIRIHIHIHIYICIYVYIDRCPCKRETLNRWSSLFSLIIIDSHRVKIDSNWTSIGVSREHCQSSMVACLNSAMPKYLHHPCWKEQRRRQHWRRMRNQLHTSLYITMSKLILSSDRMSPSKFETSQRQCIVTTRIGRTNVAKSVGIPAFVEIPKFAHVGPNFEFPNIEMLWEKHMRGKRASIQFAQEFKKHVCFGANCA